MRFVPNRVGVAVCGAVAIGLGVVSMTGARSAPPRLPDPVILDRVAPAPASRPSRPADQGRAEPVHPCVADDWGDDDWGDDDWGDDIDSADSADSMDSDCDDWNDWDDCG